MKLNGSFILGMNLIVKLVRKGELAVRRWPGRRDVGSNSVVPAGTKSLAPAGREAGSEHAAPLRPPIGDLVQPPANARQLQPAAHLPAHQPQ